LKKEELQHYLDNIGNAITDLATHVGKINKRLDDLEELVKNMSNDNSQIDFLSDDITELSEKIDGLEGSNFSNRVTDIENIIYRLRDALEVR
jgi:predicted  nucleic acid-binding Zn-ribbon protein